MRLGGPKRFNHYPWGWTWAGNTPFRRWKRETYRGGASDPFIVPGRADQGQGPGPRTVRAHHRHGAHGAGPAGHRAARSDQGRHPVTPARRQLRQHPGRRRRGSNRHTQYFEMLGHRAIYHDGWRAVCPWPGPSFAEAGIGFGQPISAQTLSELDATAGSFTTWRRISPRTTTWPPPPRPADRDDRDVVRRGRQVQRDAGRRQRPGPDDRRKAARRAAPRQLHLPARHAVDTVLRRAQGP